MANVVYTNDEIDHFCPQLFALTLFILTIFLATKNVDQKSARVTSALIILFSFGIIISHPITPFFLIPALFAVWFYNSYVKNRGGKNEHSIVSFPLVCLVLGLFIAWSVFFPGSSFAQGISQIASLENPNLSSQVQVFHDPTQLLVFLGYYWKLLAVIVLVPSAYLGFRYSRRKGADAENKFMPICWMLFGIAVGGLALSATSLVDLTRVLTFLLIPGCLLAVYFVSKFSNTP